MEAELDREAMSTLSMNRVGVPSRPTKTIADLLTFLVSTEAINSAVAFISYDGSSEISNDQ